MHRFTKLISLASIGSALTITPALAGTERYHPIDSLSDRAHSVAFGSPSALTIDVPAVATPALSTPSVRTPDPTSCVRMQPIRLPVAVQLRPGRVAGDLSTPASTWDVGTCATVPSESVARIPVASKTVDVAATTVAVPASVAKDESGTQSSAGNGMAVAQADESGRSAGLDIATGTSDISVDVAPQL